MSKHNYGCSLQEDLKALYGSESETLDGQRVELFYKYEAVSSLITSLNNIIQNPVPITSNQYNEWLNLKIKVMKELKDILRKTEQFVEDNHLDK